jgi:YfiH family protein
VLPSPYRFSTFSSLAHLVSTRHGGVSPAPYATLNLGYGTADAEERVTANREVVRRAVTAPEQRFISARLSHGTDVAVYHRDRQEEWPSREAPVRSGSRTTMTAFDADGVVSDVPALHFVLTFADCVPLLFLDRARGAIGLAHAGWRGTAAGIGPAVVSALIRNFGSRPQDIQVGIGPSIGPCCYEVGLEVTASFRKHGFSPAMRGNRLDLWESTAHQLRSAGVRRVEVAGICTRCNTDQFFSHRGENGVTGRFALVAGLTA